MCQLVLIGQGSGGFTLPRRLDANMVDRYVWGSCRDGGRLLRCLYSCTAFEQSEYRCVSGWIVFPADKHYWEPL